MPTAIPSGRFLNSPEKALPMSRSYFSVSEIRSKKSFGEEAFMDHAHEKFPAEAADRVMDRIFRYRASHRAFRIIILFTGSAILFFALFLPFHNLKRPGHSITFTLYAPEARHVSLVGDFNQWDESGIPMTETRSGEWTVTLRLEPGSYRYLFSV
ncbi:MAG TPA: hypothetical protein ENL15_03560, partial [Firmicutes bacterium]|nr:hypothetical protein [Bacillota bacterium]